MTTLRPRLVALALCLVTSVLAACGGGSGGDPDADPAAVVPARAPVYLEAQLDPEGELEDDLRAISQKLAGTDDPGGEIVKLLEKEIREQDKDFSFEDDIEPWLGDRIAVFVTNLRVSGASEETGANAAIVIPTTDADKAKEFLDEVIASPGDSGEKPRVVERTHRDVKYKYDEADETGFVMLDDYAVFGDDPGLKSAIDAHAGDGLSETDAFKRARDQVPDDGLGFAYLGVRQFFSGLGPQAAAIRPLLAGIGDSVAIALDVDPDAIRFDAATQGASGPAGAGPGKVLAELPGDSWLAFGASDLGGTVERAIQQLGQLGALGGVDVEQQLRRQLGLDIQRDVVSWMGDAGIFVTGTSLASIGGGVVVEVKDRDRAVAAVPKLARLVAGAADLRVAPLRTSGVDAGFRLRGDDLPVPVDLGIVDDRFIIGVGTGTFAAAADPDTPLGESPAYRDASAKLGDGYKPSFFVNMDPVRELAGGLGLDQQGEAGRRFSRALDALTTIAAGGRRDGDVQRFRAVIGVK